MSVAIKPSGLDIQLIPIKPKSNLSPLVFLHGWGCDSAIWAEFPIQLAKALGGRDVILVNLPGFAESPPLQDTSLEALLTLLADQLPAKAIVLGWSLGGMVATAYAAQYSERVEALVSLGSNASYVQRADWPHAIAQDNLDYFIAQIKQNPQRIIPRFRANQVLNDPNEKVLLKLAKSLSPPFKESWIAPLELLGEIDNREALARLSCPSLCLLGEKDSLVPVEAAKDIAALNRNLQVEVLADVAHILHLSAPEKVIAVISNFLKQQSVRDKRQVAESFSRSAKTYDDAAHLQKATGNQLFQLLPKNLSTNPVLLDLGCGTGYFKRELAKQFQHAEIIGLDLAEGMLQFAKTNIQGGYWCCGDAEQLPIANNSIDAIFSNLAIQWCNNLPALAEELYRVLKPGGTAVLSSLASQTLCELKAAWQTVDQHVHVNNFETVASVEQHFASQPFEKITINTETRTTEYETSLDLFRELKALGAHNVNKGRPTSLTGKGRFNALSAAYEPFRLNGQLPATWQVVYIVIQKPDIKAAS